MNITIPIECSEGHQYLLKFSDCRNLPINIDVNVVDITLSLASEIDIINNTATLNKISSVIFNFLDENDVVLYFYCSKEPIIKRNNRKAISSQEYRSQLFSAMFNKTVNKCVHPNLYINTPVVLRDNVEGDHYLHFISRSKHAERVSEFAKYMEVNFEKITN